MDRIVRARHEKTPARVGRTREQRLLDFMPPNRLSRLRAESVKDPVPAAEIDRFLFNQEFAHHSAGNREMPSNAQNARIDRSDAGRSVSEDERVFEEG